LSTWTILAIIGGSLAAVLGAMELHLRRSHHAERSRGYRRKERFKL
jgi:hypothetical protein